MSTTSSKHFRVGLGIVILGQILFAMMSQQFTTPKYEGRIYATTGVKHQQEDLHKLNEAAHYFGQTIIGWLKFPNFMGDLSQAVQLPEDASILAYIQERQNIIFTVSSTSPLDLDQLKAVKDFIQSRLDEYNSLSQTEFVLSNLDYELVEVSRSYLFGALVTLLASLVIAFGLAFVQKEFST